MSEEIDLRVVRVKAEDFVKKQEVLGLVRSKRIEFLTGTNPNPGRIRDDAGWQPRIPLPQTLADMVEHLRRRAGEA